MNHIRIEDLNIIGCGGHARSVADIAIRNERDIRIVFFDDNAKNNEIILGGLDVRTMSELGMGVNGKCIVAVGDNTKRENYFNRYNELEFISIVSNNAHIGYLSTIERGCFVGEMAHIGPETIIYENCIINNGAIIEHECIIGKSSHVSVGAKICGRTIIGQRNMIGAGAVVIDKVSTCDDVVIGAGAVVASDIVESGTYVGVPAKRIK